MMQVRGSPPLELSRIPVYSPQFEVQTRQLPQAATIKQAL